ncbi:MAG: protein kinase [Acutalibacteraceae bacterium]|nr:protein kinase [Acutalibacteraceae bacterium]
MEVEKIWKGWKVEKEIGEGSFGKVFKIVREEFGQRYESALKVIKIPQNASEVETVKNEGMSDESITAYFESMVYEIVDEFTLMSKLKGISNIVSYEDHAVVPLENSFGWEIFIRMELLTPLFTYIKQNSFSVKDVIQLGIDICKALEVCQKYNIIHRDIKPENIFVSNLGIYKLGDFGIARQLEKSTSGMSKKGTYSYMAPEVYQGHPYDATVDIYSLGIVLYRFLNNNRTPFLPPYPNPIKFSDKEQSNILRMSGEKMPKPCNAEGRLTEIVLKACAYNPADRYSSATEMRKELEEVLSSGSESSIVPSSISENSLSNSVQGSIHLEKDFKKEKTEYLFESSEISKNNQIESESKKPEKNEGTVYLFGSDEEKARKEAERQAKIQAEERARREAEEKARREEQERIEAERQAKLREEERARRDAEEKARRKEQERLEAERQAKIQAEERARREAEEKARRKEQERLEAERRAKIQEEERVRREAKRLEKQARKEAKLNNESKKQSGNVIDKKKKFIIASSVLAVIIIVGIVTISIISNKAAERVVPRIINISEIAASELLENNDLKLKVNKKVYSDTVKEGYIISQAINQGDIVDKGTEIGVVLSLGKNFPNMPDLRNISLTEAMKKLKELSINYKVEKIYDKADVDMVISQSISSGEKLAEDSIVVLTVSKGKKPKETKKTTTTAKKTQSTTKRYYREETPTYIPETTEYVPKTTAEQKYEEEDYFYVDDNKDDDVIWLD